MLPVTLANPTVIKLPPVMLPVAVINPPVPRLPTLALPEIDVTPLTVKKLAVTLLFNPSTITVLSSPTTVPLRSPTIPAVAVTVPVKVGFCLTSNCMLSTVALPVKITLLPAIIASVSLGLSATTLTLPTVIILKMLPGADVIPYNWLPLPMKKVSDCILPVTCNTPLSIVVLPVMLPLNVVNPATVKVFKEVTPLT